MSNVRAQVKGILRSVGLLGCFLLVACYGARRPGNAPHIAEAYYKCESPRILIGGIWGLGPMRRFYADPSQNECQHWVAISRAEFKRLASEWFHHDWQKDIVWWSEVHPNENAL